MIRRPSKKSIQIVLGLIVGIGIGVTRTEKIFAELLWDKGGDTGVVVSNKGSGFPFDPARVPSSGGMASRLLAGITVRPV